MIEYIQTQLETNQVLTGIIGGGLFGGVLYILRSVPEKIWTWYVRNFVWCVRVNNDDTFFTPIMIYFSEILKHKTCRLRLSQENNKINFLPNYGDHYYWVGINLVIISITEEPLENSKERKENIEIKIYGYRTKKVFDHIIKESIKFQKEKFEEYYIYDYNYCWDQIKLLPNRRLENIYIDKPIKDNIINDIENFYNNEEFYIKFGLPYKRGYIFYGEPGTGKSSIIIALANHFKKHICYLDLNTLEDSKDVIRAFSKIPKNSILVMEDVEINNTTHARSNTTAPSMVDSDNDTPKISLSTVLQMLDGIYITDGTIVIATTNHFNKLDAAFIRDGRFDLKLEFKLADKKLAEEMIKNIDKSKIHLLNSLQYPISQAELQNKILNYEITRKK